MGSKTFDGVRFAVYSNDHFPPHVHGSAEEVRVILELLSDGTVVRARRQDAIQPGNAKRSTIAKIERIAAANSAALIDLWEKTHGKR